MTTRNGAAAAQDAGTDEVCLVVVHCAGAGCRSTDIAPAHRNAGAAALRAAVRDRRHTVLVAAPCLRRCQPGGTAAIGWATVGDGRIRWTSPPVVLDGLEGASADGGRARVAALADWIRSGATGSAALHGLSVTPINDTSTDQPR